MLLVCNASPLIFLAKIDLIDVLPQLTENLTIPVGVYQEIKGQNDAACEKALQNPKPTDLDWRFHHSDPQDHGTPVPDWF